MTYLRKRIACVPRLPPGSAAGLSVRFGRTVELSPKHTFQNGAPGNLQFGSGGRMKFLLAAADGSGAVERLTESPNRQQTVALSPDGRSLILPRQPRRRTRTWMQVELGGTRRVTPRA